MGFLSLSYIPRNHEFKGKPMTVFICIFQDAKTTYSPKPLLPLGQMLCILKKSNYSFFFFSLNLYIPERTIKQSLLPSDTKVQDRQALCNFPLCKVGSGFQEKAWPSHCMNCSQGVIVGLAVMMVEKMLVSHTGFKSKLQFWIPAAYSCRLWLEVPMAQVVGFLPCGRPELSSLLMVLVLVQL